MEEQNKSKPDLVDMAKKRRHLHLLEKLAKGKSDTPALSKSEIKELTSYELPPGSPAVVDTQEKVAKAFSVAVRTVQRWEREGMPITKKGDYDLTEIQAWRFIHRNRKQTKKEGKTNWEEEYRMWKAKEFQLKFLKLKGDLIPQKDVEAAFVQRIITVKRSLLALPRALAPQLTGLSTRELEVSLRSYIEEIIKNFSKESKLFKKDEKRHTGKLAARRNKGLGASAKAHSVRVGR